MEIPRPLAAPLAVVPVPLIEGAVRLMFSSLLKRHPALFERLGEHKAKRFAFRPSDLPLVFLVEPARPVISVIRRPADPPADAAVEGPLFLLLALLEGRCDADALFFSRALTVVGDMEAMLALRNALDGSEIDLPRDLGAAAGPVAPLVSRTAAAIRRRALSGETVAWS
ncbi:SCP2 sterol-binding domain-containing protein [Sinorhizobium sp. CCBAU 05631]|uniref:ubiquinone anaerobic biosynthesis accessory factor UbiT n=1 Tax=Sinorhizobium sp. CCBAU 05631 TaxID=794846 RepID=UPI0004AE0937|nr:SCP2 sterol-binding domain-containing protein [Sinorhizobium sp. CCBAU 05631]ASY60779.1 Sterol binding protein [Sinorhizobium sp. CCBAU 05631]